MRKHAFKSQNRRNLMTDVPSRHNLAKAPTSGELSDARRCRYYVKKRVATLDQADRKEKRALRARNFWYHS